MILLTKAIGTGVISTAFKRGIESPAHVERSHRLHAHAEPRRRRSHGADLEVHGCHRHHRDSVCWATRERWRWPARGGKGGHARNRRRQVRFFDGAVEYARAGAIPTGLKNNREFIESCVERMVSLRGSLLYDPQTSGGLLLSMTEKAAVRSIFENIRRLMSLAA